MIQKGDSRYKKFIDICFMEVKQVLRPYSDKFSKKTYTQHQHAVAILLMKHERKSYRDVVELLNEFCAYFGFDKSIPRFTTLEKFFMQIPTYVWDFLIAKPMNCLQELLQMWQSTQQVTGCITHRSTMKEE